MRHNKHREDNYDLLVPASVLLRVVNRDLGTDLKTLDEITEYFKEHPEARQLLGRNKGRE